MALVQGEDTKSDEEINTLSNQLQPEPDIQPTEAQDPDGGSLEGAFLIVSFILLTYWH